MIRRPTIGIISALHSTGYILPGYSTTAHYLEQVEKAGGIPVQLPVMPGVSEEVLREMVSRCDGFLLPGGGDFAPEWYGETLLPNLSPDSMGIDRESQKTALQLIRLMAKSGKPILGICLGIQVLTVALGGNLYQDIPTQVPSELCHREPALVTEDRWRVAHTVLTEEGSLIRSLSGAAEIGVNSFHHQAVKTPAPGFHVTARASDGLTEAVESADGNILAVQWHPENLAHAGIPAAEALFNWLIKKSSC